MHEGLAVAATRWLIEVGMPRIFYCGPGDWCSNPNHALRWKDKADALAELRHFPVSELVGGRAEVCEHVWNS